MRGVAVSGATTNTTTSTTAAAEEVIIGVPQSAEFDEFQSQIGGGRLKHAANAQQDDH